MHTTQRPGKPRPALPTSNSVLTAASSPPRPVPLFDLGPHHQSASTERRVPGRAWRQLTQL